MISADEYLERIVAGIHAVTSAEADVAWNEDINGRQFDVVVRFRLGTLSYLVLVEVRNRTRKASASDVEAFVLKARDQNANKSVFVTLAGFQSGAIDVAKRHGLDLFTVAFDRNELELPREASWLLLKTKIDSAPPELAIGETTLVNQIEAVTLVYADGTSAPIPDEQSQMAYYARQSKLADGRTLHNILQALNIRDIVGKGYADELVLTSPMRMQPPDELCFPAGVITSIRYTVTARLARPIKGNTQIDPSAFASPVIYTDVTTGETMRFNLGSLPLGTKRVSAGKYYFTLYPLMYFYCASIEGSIATWKLIESFQNGELIRATLTQDVKYSRSYIPVTDREILTRLQARLDHYDALSTSG
jgi:Restriction endonuclease